MRKIETIAIKTNTRKHSSFNDNETKMLNILLVCIPDVLIVVRRNTSGVRAVRNLCRNRQLNNIDGRYSIYLAEYT